MNKRKKLGRGLEDFSHLFISSEDAEKGPAGGSLAMEVAKAKTGAKTIAVLSRSEEPSNPFLILNIAIELSKEGKKVVLMDTDGRAPHMNLFLGSIPSSSFLSLCKNVRKEKTNKNKSDIKHVIMDIDISSLDYLLHEEKGAIYQKLTEIEGEADIILIYVTNNHLHSLKGIIQNISDVIVSTPSYPVGMVEAYSMIKKVFLLNPDTRLGLIVDESEQEEEGLKVFTRMENVVKKHLRKPIYHLGTILKEPAIEESVRSRKPLSLLQPDSQNVLSFKEIAKVICSEHFKEKGLAEIFQFAPNGFETQTY